MTKPRRAAGRWLSARRAAGRLALAWMMLSASALAATPQELADVEAKASYAFHTENANALKNQARTLSAWAKSSDPAELYGYAFTQFRVLQLATIGGRKSEAGSAGTACVDALDRANDIAETAEARALESACYGYLAQLGGLKAISNGPKSGSRMEAALKLAPRNPRVLLVDGFGLHFRPSAFGGDKDKAFARFQEATRAFDAPSRARAGEPTWGAAEAWVFVGRGHLARGETAAARTAFEKALALAPEFAAARRGLAGKR